MKREDTLRRVAILSTILILMSPLVLMPLETIIPSDAVVVMYDDSTVKDSINAITTYDDDILVLEYGSIGYALMIPRIIGTVVWISHGTEDGIVSNSEILSWEDFVSSIQLTSGKDVVLACESDHIYNYVSNDEAFAFSGAVDAKLGGFFVAWLLTGIRDALTSAFARITTLRDGSAVSDNLYWSTMERAWFGIDAALFMVSALSTSFALWKITLNPMSTMVVFAAALQFLSVFLQFTVFMCGACSGTLSPLSVATKLISCIGMVIWAILTCAPWYVQILTGVEAVVTGAARLVPLVLMIISLVTLVANMFNDMADPDSLYGRVYVGF
ncbi:MAG: hypothetical protein ACFFEK_07380 [Candidatus Thorarchaeota archaeon]